MKFHDMFVFKDDRFSVGVEEPTGRYYLAIPVANPYVEYEEYYEIHISEYQACPQNIDELRKIAAKCRARENDSCLLMEPGRLRGTPV